MTSSQIFQQSIYIAAPVSVVEQCVTDRDLMHRWLNPALRCEPVGKWSSDVGSQSRFIVQIPLVQPTLNSVIAERRPGLVVWSFEGFFRGRDRWECRPEGTGTRLLNRFEFKIPNAFVRYGFETFAADWTRRDMQTQLHRLKQVAEKLAVSLESRTPAR